MTKTEVLIERVIQKTLAHLHIEVDITSHLRSCFKVKLWRMGKAFSRAGGTKRKQILSQWKSSEWNLKIDLQSANKKLGQRKRRNEASLQAECTKRQKLELQVKELESSAKALKKTTQKQAVTIQKLRSGKLVSARGPSSKSWQSLSRQHRAVKKKQLAADIQSSLSFCDSSVFHPVSLQVENTHTGDSEVLDLKVGSLQQN